MPAAAAFIPARSGSERVPGKNVRLLAGHPLLAYSIAAAHESGVFDSVVVATDSPTIAEVAAHYGASVPGLRPPEISTSTSPDIEWVLHLTGLLEKDGAAVDVFSILRPTSPFRGPLTIRRAFGEFLAAGERVDSLRAVERCRQHPGKMWVIAGELLEPLLPQPAGETPLHSRQYQALPPVYVQNSSIELAWRHVLDPPQPTISGTRIAPFFTEGAEGFSIDYPDDFGVAERLVAAGGAQLPGISVGAHA